MPSFPYKRWCLLKIVNNCQEIVDAQNSKRTKWCNICLERLGLLKISVKRFLQMKEEKIEEKVEWKDKDNCVMTITEEIPLKNQKGELIGIRKSDLNVKTTRKEIEEGMAIPEENVHRNNIKLKQLTQQLTELGKKPVKTSEMIRLQKNIQEINKINQINKLEAQQKELVTAIQNDEKFIINRKKILDQAPKEEEK